MASQHWPGHDVRNDNLPVDMVTRSRGLYTVPASMCRGSAATKAEHCGDGQGFLSWWRVHREANPGTSGQQAVRMQALLGHKFRRDHLLTDLDGFDLQVSGMKRTPASWSQTLSRRPSSPRASATTACVSTCS